MNNNILVMSAKNTKRYGERTIIVIVSIAISVFVSILVDAVLMGLINQSTSNLLNFESPEISIMPKGMLDGREANQDLVINAGDKIIIENLLEHNGIQYCENYTRLADFIRYNDVDFDFSSIGFISGVDPQKVKKIFLLHEYLIDGDWIDDNNPNGVVLGTGLADKLHVSAGQDIVISVTSSVGFDEAINLSVIGLIETENLVVNNSYAFMPIKTLNDYLGLEGSVMSLMVSDGKLSVANKNFATNIRKILKDVNSVDVYHYSVVNQDLLEIMNGDKGSSYFILLFLFILAGVGIVNLQMMNVFERKNECSMLRALGFNKFKIKFMFLMEGLIIGLIGTFVGIFCSAVVNYPLAKIGINLSRFIMSDSLDYGYRVATVLRTNWSMHSFVGIPMCSLILTIIASYIPIRNVFNGEIAESMRGEGE